jgi:hypothetical protein
MTPESAVGTDRHDGGRWEDPSGAGRDGVAVAVAVAAIGDGHGGPLKADPQLVEYRSDVRVHSRQWCYQLLGNVLGGPPLGRAEVDATLACCQAEQRMELLDEGELGHLTGLLDGQLVEGPQGLGQAVEVEQGQGPLGQTCGDSGDTGLTAGTGIPLSTSAVVRRAGRP